VLSAVLVWYTRGQRHELELRKREVVYQTALASYSQAVPVGMTRQSVERYLRKNGTAFRQMCCIDEPSAVVDLVLIGKEKPPWMCSERTVYVAFQSAAHDSHQSWHAGEADVLKRVTIYQWSEGCL
jgi:hypothetical protein